MERVPEKWPCGDCRGVITSTCHPDNLPSQAAAGKCKRFYGKQKAGKPAPDAS